MRVGAGDGESCPVRQLGVNLNANLRARCGIVDDMNQFTLEQGSALGIVEVDSRIRDEQGESPKMAIVYRSYTKATPEKDWQAGAYVLVDSLPDEEGRRRVYVGESTKGGLSQRVWDHIKAPPKGMEKWGLAVIIYQQQVKGEDIEIEFKEAQALEHVLFETLEGNKSVVLKNTRPPKEIPLLKNQRAKLDAFAVEVVELLKVLGFDVQREVNKNYIAQVYKHRDTEYISESGKSVIVQTDQKSREIKKKQTISNRPNVSLTDLVNSGHLHHGEILVPVNDRYDNIEAKIIVEDDKAKILFDGKEYKSLSTPADNISGSSQNGWKFWCRKYDRTKMQAIRDQFLRQQT